MVKKIRNWGRWGDDDQIGTLNYITETNLLGAAACIRKGATFSLAISIDEDSVWSASGRRRNPIHLMTVDGGDANAFQSDALDEVEQERHFRKLWNKGLTRYNDDLIIMALQSSTQWDALSHVYFEDRHYNGIPSSSVTSFGATKLGIEHAALHGVVGRGVLLDVARYRGVPHIPEKGTILPKELEATAAAQHVQIRPGDIVLVRTGWWAQFPLIDDKATWRANCPGLDWRTAEWLHEMQVAAVAADNLAVEPSGSEEGSVALPLHVLCLREMGMMLGELWNLEGLAADCAQDSVYEFQLVAPPLRIRGGVGAPLNPIAIK
jgi:kynurenine formamidase